MRHRAILKTLGYVLLIFSVTFVLPVMVGSFYGEPGDRLFMTYILPLLLTVSFGGTMMWVGREEEDLRDREAFIAVSLAYILLALFGSLPFLLSRAVTNPLDAFFESTSGFTTTGASVLMNVEDFSITPHSLILWRAETALIGGMGIILLSMVVLSRIVGGSSQLFRAEASAHASIRIKPTIRQIASTLWAIYLGFNLILIALLAAAGMDLFDATCHAFTCLSTCGFSSKNAGPAFWNANPAIGVILTVFMILGAMSFTVHYEWIRGKFSKLRQNPEFITYLGILLASGILVAITLFFQDSALEAGGSGYRSGGEVVGHSMFNCVSIMTTTGYASTDFSLWPSGPQLLLIFLMIVGGCSGSTAGGIKIIRFIVLAKMVRREIQKVIHPRAIMPITLGGRPVPEEALRNIVSYFFIYISIFCIVALGLTLVGMRIDEGLATSASSMGGVGPALGNYGPMSNYALLHPAGKVLMCIAMWLGRLEIYPALILFSPSAYKR